MKQGYSNMIYTWDMDIEIADVPVPVLITFNAIKNGRGEDKEIELVSIHTDSENKRDLSVLLNVPELQEEILEIMLSDIGDRGYE